MQHQDDSWLLGDLRFYSRLIVGVGAFASLAETRHVLKRSGTELVLISMRTLLRQTDAPSLLDAVDLDRHRVLPASTDCYNADDAVRALNRARELGMGELVNVSVIGDPKTLFPDNAATIAAAERLIKDGFGVLASCSDDLITCRRLQELGCLAVMPMAAPPGSGQGINNAQTLRFIIDNAQIPVILDAGLGTTSHAALAMEMGCAAIVTKSAIPRARSPQIMADAMREAVSAGRKAHVAGPMPKRVLGGDLER